MSCIHPLIAFPGKLSKNGKIQYIPVAAYNKYEIDMYYGRTPLEWKKSAGDALKPILLPCGKCIGCRLDKSREWALRCMMELKYHEKASFLTLTYSETNIKMVYFPDPETGLALPVYTLDLDHLTKFWKRLRKTLPDKIRYFACGEYGSETFRPHYHAIVFGYWPDDVRKYQVMDTTTYYKSDTLNRIWSYGEVLVAPVNFDTCAYVARYTAKKSLTLGDDFFTNHNMTPPFLVMSRRPGIGWRFMEEHMDAYRSGHVYVSGSDPVDGSIPRSFVNKLENIDPVMYNEIKRRQELKGNTYERALAYAHKVSYSELLAAAESNLLARSKAIRRNKL